MTVQAYILMTQSERDDAEELNGDGVALGSQEITNILANNLGLGTIVGKWVAPARLLNDPDYSRWVPTLGSLPVHIFDTDVIFAPVSIEL